MLSRWQTFKTPTLKSVPNLLGSKGEECVNTCRLWASGLSSETLTSPSLYSQIIHLGIWFVNKISQV